MAISTPDPGKKSHILPNLAWLINCLLAWCTWQILRSVVHLLVPQTMTY